MSEGAGILCVGITVGTFDATAPAAGIAATADGHTSGAFVQLFAIEATAADRMPVSPAPAERTSPPDRQRCSAIQLRRT